MKNLFLILFLASVVSTQADDVPTPIVLWHGMGDNCCHSFSMGAIKKLLEGHLPNVYVHPLMIGNSPNEDTLNGFFMNVNQQIGLACDRISKDPKLQNGFNALGFSQGGQFLRAVAQRCPHLGMQKLISFGGQHQGIYGLPKCSGSDLICDYVRRLLNYGAYTSWVQDKLVQAQYWHDPLDEKKYRDMSEFLADINNDKDVKNKAYKDNLIKLEKLVLVKFANDTTVVPRGTEWFGFYKPGQAKEMLAYNETRLYKEDWIGLKTLDEQGKVDFLISDGDHLQFSDQFLFDVIKNYLA